MMRMWIVLIIVTALLSASGCHTSAPADKPIALPSNSDAAKNQDLARALTDLSFTLINKSDFPRAEDALKRAIAADAMYGPAHNNLGLVYFHNGDLYHAAWEFQNATKLMPRQAPPMNNLGLVLEQADRLSDAEKSYAGAFQLEPDNPQYIGNYARARIRQGEYDEATRKLLESILLKDRRPEWISWARERLSRWPKLTTREAN